MPSLVKRISCVNQHHPCKPHGTAGFRGQPNPWDPELADLKPHSQQLLRPSPAERPGDQSQQGRSDHSPTSTTFILGFPGITVQTKQSGPKALRSHIPYHVSQNESSEPGKSTQNVICDLSFVTAALLRLQHALPSHTGTPLTDYQIGFSQGFSPLTPLFHVAQLLCPCETPPHQVLGTQKAAVGARSELRKRRHGSQSRSALCHALLHPAAARPRTAQYR